MPKITQTRGRWDAADPEHQARAHRIRRSLADAFLYHTGDLAGPEWEVYEANCREALHQVADELDRADLAAVLNVARLLALVPRDPALFDYVRRKDERAMAPFWREYAGADVGAAAKAEMADEIQGR